MGGTVRRKPFRKASDDCLKHWALLNRFITAYGVSEATLKPYALGISVKNNRKILA